MAWQGAVRTAQQAAVCRVLRGVRRQQSMPGECRRQKTVVMPRTPQGAFFTGRQGLQNAVRRACGKAWTIGCDRAVSPKSAVGGCCLACDELGAEGRSAGLCRAVKGVAGRGPHACLVLRRAQRSSHSGLAHMIEGDGLAHMIEGRQSAHAHHG